MLLLISQTLLCHRENIFPSRYQLNPPPSIYYDNSCKHIIQPLYILTALGLLLAFRFLLSLFNDPRENKNKKKRNRSIRCLHFVIFFRFPLIVILDWIFYVFRISFQLKAWLLHTSSSICSLFVSIFAALFSVV